MPKNKGKGGKNRRRGKNENDFMKRELETKEVGQEYGQVNKMLGNGRVEATCFDGKTRICHIRGKLRKKVWIGPGDFILIGLRDYQDDKADVLSKYTADEARRLKASGELPENAKINENDDQDEGEIVFKDTGHDDGEEVGSDSEEDMPSSGSDSEEEGDEKTKTKKKEEDDDDDDDDEEEEESSEESEEESDDGRSFLNEDDLAAGRGYGGRGGRGGRGNKNKYGKRR